ncbi:uncharacterized protein Z518_06351 [Rhinocladiella mackenziei CBS 650.93]|uniref:Uncharacterized protein n=1 Tax=Rhinocladiella mackenziei CBS 650.93 TaxID=1442369 RepID=A0A0D2IIB2_9EURO|nr:uncharacterized protein Z518_06351 [Rhinocladiella mackenziei CBS 650.93]KIX05479.1 hypothetical protein Z518_06351 [Rhinocladiella mackenziei CBS 650.93]
MPALKDLVCQVLWADTGSPFPEYGTQYGDGVVESYIAIPNHPQPFTIQLTSRKFIFEGLSMIVFIDGSYQCNRNRVNLKPPKEGVPRNRTEIDFVVRQKEKVIGDGTYMGREWRFDDYNIVSQLPQGVNESHFDELGTIEVLVLRCCIGTSGEFEMSTASSGEDSAVLGGGDDDSQESKTNKSDTASRREENSAEVEGQRELDGVLGGFSGGIFDGLADQPPLSLGTQGDAPSTSYHGWNWQQAQHAHRGRPAPYGLQEGQFYPQNYWPVSGRYEEPTRSSDIYRALPSSSIYRQPALGPAKPGRHVHFDYSAPHVGSHFRYDDRPLHRSQPGCRGDNGYVRPQTASGRLESTSRRGANPCSDYPLPPHDGHYFYNADQKIYSRYPYTDQGHGGYQPRSPPNGPPPQIFAGPSVPLPQPHPQNASLSAPHPAMTTFQPDPPPDSTPLFHTQGPGFLDPATEQNNMLNDSQIADTQDPPNNSSNNDTSAGRDQKTGDDNACDTNNAENNNAGWDDGDWNNGGDANDNRDDYNGGPNDQNQSGNDHSWDPNQNNGGWDGRNQNAGRGGNNQSNDWNNDQDNNSNLNNQSNPAEPLQTTRALYGPHGAYYTSKACVENGVPPDAEEEPRYDVPRSMVEAKGISKQVQSGKGYIYTKKRCVPEYIDNLDEPYAKFVFKYRTKEQLKNEIGVDIGSEPTGNEDVNALENLDKAELIQMVLRAKGALGGSIPSPPPEKVTPASINSYEQVPVTPPEMEFLRYNLPPTRNVTNPGLGIHLSNQSNVQNPDRGNPNHTDWSRHGNAQQTNGSSGANNWRKNRHQQNSGGGNGQNRGGVGWVQTNNVANNNYNNSGWNGQRKTTPKKSSFNQVQAQANQAQNQKQQNLDSQASRRARFQSQGMASKGTTYTQTPSNLRRSSAISLCGGNWANPPAPANLSPQVQPQGQAQLHPPGPSTAYSFVQPYDAGDSWPTGPILPPPPPNIDITGVGFLGGGQTQFTNMNLEKPPTPPIPPCSPESEDRGWTSGVKRTPPPLPWMQSQGTGAGNFGGGEAAAPPGGW